MTTTPSKELKKVYSVGDWQKVLQEFIDPPKPWNLTVGLFIGGYLLFGLSIWEWYQGDWPLQVLVGLAFLALHMEGTVIPVSYTHLRAHET